MLHENESHYPEIIYKSRFHREEKEHIRPLHIRGVSVGMPMADGRLSGIAYTIDAKAEGTNQPNHLCFLC